MRVWKLDTDNKVQIGVKDFESDYTLYFGSQFKGTPVEKWGNVVMEIYKGAGKRADALYFVSGKPIVSEKAVEVLSGYLDKRVEVLPLVHDLYPIFAINVLNIVDGIDQDSAVPKYTGDVLVGYERYAFLQERVAGQHIFKIPQELSLKVFVSDEFKQTVENNKLVGFAFIEVWDSEPKGPTINVEEIEVPLTLTYGEAMEIVEQGEKAVVNGNDKWQKAKNGKVLLGYRMPDGSYKWMEPIYIPIPHLLAKWGIAEKSDI